MSSSWNALDTSSIQPLALADAIALLRDFGYSEVEANFVYLVTTHSGYFTRQQFLSFTSKTKGWAVHHFTEKLLARGHAKVVPLAHGRYLFQLRSQEIYEAIGRPNLRIRSKNSESRIVANLLTLDFVLAHPTLNYLETSSDKLDFFDKKMGLPMTILPGKIFAGIESLKRETRYFTDRFPIFLKRENTSEPDLLTPVFVYCDPYRRSIDGFKAHLKRYANLLYRLPRFRYIYAAPSPKKFKRASQVFTRLMCRQERTDTQSLIRYFRVRWLWEAGNPCEMTREDRDIIRDGDKKYCGEPFASIYENWSLQALGEAELKSLLGPYGPEQKYCFGTCLLPDQYDLFAPESSTKSGTESGTIREVARSATRSDSRSVAESENWF